MKIAIIGASGAIGEAFLEHFLNSSEAEKLYLFSRSEVSNQDVRVIHQYIDIEDEDSIEEAANTIPNHENLDYIIASTGILYTDNVLPEKSVKDLSYAKFSKLYAVNTIGPALIGKHFIHKLSSNSRSIFAVLSARVGSISDNILGGWYSYRCSKAALNMLIKNFSIEARRKNPNLIAVGLHPGTVESTLSKPFYSNIRSDKILSPEYSVIKMVRVLENLTYEDSGKLFAWDGSIIDF